MLMLYLSGVILVVASIIYWRVSGPLGSLPTYEDLKHTEQRKKDLK